MSCSPVNTSFSSSRSTVRSRAPRQDSKMTCISTAGHGPPCSSQRPSGTTGYVSPCRAQQSRHLWLLSRMSSTQRSDKSILWCSLEQRVLVKTASGPALHLAQPCRSTICNAACSLYSSACSAQPVPQAHGGTTLAGESWQTHHRPPPASVAICVLHACFQPHTCNQTHQVCPMGCVQHLERFPLDGVDGGITGGEATKSLIGLSKQIRVHIVPGQLQQTAHTHLQVLHSGKLDCMHKVHCWGMEPSQPGGLHSDAQAQVLTVTRMQPGRVTSQSAEYALT